MKLWYQKRELHHLLRMFHKAVACDDALHAAALYGCLFDFLQIARTRLEDRRQGYRWKRIVQFLDKELDEIQKAAQDYPVTIQQALVAKIILRQEARKAH